MKTPIKIGVIFFSVILIACTFSTMAFANATTIYCPNCGTQIDAQDHYCFNCAYDIAAYQESLKETSKTSGSDQKMENNKTPQQIYDEGYNLWVGRGVKKDPERAVELFMEAAERGNSDAQNMLGECYYNGEYVKQDYSNALYWYKMSAENGNMWGEFNLGKCYYNGNGVLQDYSKAVEWFTKSALQGNEWGEYNLGCSYFDGKGNKRDYEKAVYWFTKAAKQNNALAQERLAYCYEKGNGVQQDYKKAAEWYQKAAEQGEAYSQNALATLYFYGNGVKQDYNKAMEWFDKASAQGYYVTIPSIPPSEKTVETIYCPNCGKQIDANSKYCMYCRHEIVAEQQSSAVSQSSSTSNTVKQSSPYIIGTSENTFAGLYKKMCVNLDLKKNPVPTPDTEEGQYDSGQYEYVKILKHDSETKEYIGYVRFSNGTNRYLVRSWLGYHKDGALIEMVVYYTLDGKYLGNIQRDHTAGTSTSSHNSPYFIPGEPLNHE